MEKIYKNKKIVVMGLGLHGGGVGVAKFFIKQGANVLITDLKVKEQLRESIDKLKGLSVKYSLGGHKKEDFENADLIIKNPDVPNSSPYLEIARKKNIKIETDTSLFFQLSKSFVIGVTGTKGKTTTAYLIHHLLKVKFPRVFIAGNIGVSPLEYIAKLKENDKIILELSSFELENLKTSPQIAVFTNILEDHLNRYDTMSDYIAAKKNIFRYQNKNDALILNFDDEIIRSFAKESKSKVYFYSLKKKPNFDLKDFRLFGDNNISNLMAAITVADILGVSDKDIKKQIKTFKGVAHRQEFVKEIKGVKYFNDTAATMPDAVICAIKTFRNRFKLAKIILIAGGQNKGLNFDKMADEIQKNIDYLILLPGTASDIIKSKLEGRFNFIDVKSMPEAVEKAKKSAKKGDIVLLSPGAASFNLFKNEFDRGNKFIREVKKPANEKKLFTF